MDEELGFRDEREEGVRGKRVRVEVQASQLAITEIN